MDFVPLVVAALMVAVIVDVIRSARNGQWNGVVTPVVAFISGVVVSLLLANSDFASSIAIGETGITLGDANASSIVLFGFALGSSAAKIVDLLKAIDGSDSQRRPSLVHDSN